jgi:rRNA maturation RNase YbeY
MSVIVSFSGRCGFLNRQNRNLFRELIRHISTDVEASVQLNYVFCTDEELLEINRQFLQHDYYTDIVTFGLEVTPHNIVGEIYISKDRIKENAVLYKVSEEEELVRVFSHGMLHLLGYKDKTTQEAATMRKEEERCLSLWRSIKGVSRETISI